MHSAGPRSDTNPSNQQCPLPTIPDCLRNPHPTLWIRNTPDRSQFGHCTFGIQIWIPLLDHLPHACSIRATSPTASSSCSLPSTPSTPSSPAHHSPATPRFVQMLATSLIRCFRCASAHPQEAEPHCKNAFHCILHWCRGLLADAGPGPGMAEFVYDNDYGELKAQYVVPSGNCIHPGFWGAEHVRVVGGTRPAVLAR